METVIEDANCYNWDNEKWIDVKVHVSAGIFSIQKYGRRDIIPYQGKIVWLPFKNWLRASFGKPLYCLPEKFQVNQKDKEITIEIGPPLEEPFRIKFQNDTDLNKIKSLWRTK